MDAFHQTRLMIVAPNAWFVRLFLFEQIRLLVTDGFDVQLVCAPDADGRNDLASLPCKVRLIEIVRPISFVKDCAALIQLMQLVEEWQPAIIHGHGPKPSLLAAVASVLCGVPTRLHTIHGLRSDGLRGLSRGIVRTMERLTFTCSTQCFAVSRSLAGHVVKEKLAPARKVKVLHHGSWAGISLDRFHPAKHGDDTIATRKSRGIASDDVVITYIGRLAADKGICTLAESWQTIRARHLNARLLIAGPLDSADPLRQSTLESLRKDARVVLLEGFAENVPALLAASDIFVQPSLREGLGVAALEAAAMELPVVASRVIGLVDTVRDEVSGLLLPPENAPALARALDYLLLYPEARRRFGRKGRELVQERFAQPDVLNAAMQMYSEVAMKTQFRGTWNRFGKRIFDLAVSSALLLFAAPLMLLIAAAIWFFLSRPVFFTQRRAGLHGRPIRIYKFRTMKQPAPGQAMIGTDEQRAHWLGSLLRKLSLDELPQLFNVVRGEMSLVGPRPLLLSYLPRYNAQQQHRHDALPGITGWAQVNGRNTISWEQRFELDLWYVQHRCARLDLTILLLTFGRVLRPRGITPGGKASMPEFLGASNRLHG